MTDVKPTVSASAPASRWVAITPSDATILNCRAVFVGGAGNLVAAGIEDNVAGTFVVLGGVVYPFACSRILAATTATALLALF